jgi:hypothetical protein
LSSAVTSCASPAPAAGLRTYLEEWHFNDAERMALTDEHVNRLANQKDYYKKHCE